jgi:hypothetical protein
MVLLLPHRHALQLNPLNREACDLTLRNPLLGQALSAGQLSSHSALAIVRRVVAFDPELESMPSTNSPAALIAVTLTARGSSGARRGCPSTSHKESRYRRRLRFDHIRASIWPPALFATSGIILASVALYAAFLAV